MRVEKAGRPLLSAEELKQWEEEIQRANRRHDSIYGFNYQRLGWRSGFEPAAAKLDHESIWQHHRAIEARLVVDGMLYQA